MDKVKKVYVDSRFRANDSASNSDFKFELNETLDLPDNTVCYVDDICIPHTWRTIESHNNKLYIIFRTSYMAGGGYDMTMEFNHNAYVLTIAEGNYTGISLAAEIQDLLNNFAVTFDFVVTYHVARGTISIEALASEGFDENNAFVVCSDYSVGSWVRAYPNDIWRNREGVVQNVDINQLQSLNGVLKNTEHVDITTNLQTTSFYRKYESGFLDLLNVHNIYLHCTNLGHFNSIGVKGESTIIKKIPVSSSFGYLILDSIVALHDKMDVSRQSIRTVHFSLRDVYGSVIDLHGASVSWSLIFVTTV